MAEDLDRLQRTIDQILNAASTDLKRVLREPVDVVRLLGECAADARERFDLPDAAILVDVPAGARVKGDVEQLRVAFRNLIENAIRYGVGEVHVEIHVRPISARRLEVEVSDLGLGIPASALDRVFQRFSRLQQEAARTVRGSGLGLYIVRNVARAPRRQRARRERRRGQGQPLHPDASRPCRRKNASSSLRTKSTSRAAWPSTWRPRATRWSWPSAAKRRSRACSTRTHRRSTWCCST
jgi:signal transduction histidine kinase